MARIQATPAGTQMRGFVATPQPIVDAMVDRLFSDHSPQPDDDLLDPGCGTGAFIDGVLRWCGQRRRPLPRITGIELDPRHHAVLRKKYERIDAVRVARADFLAANGRRPYKYIVGNPPYVAITSLSDQEKARYRARYLTATGRFDLYVLFFEQALRQLAPGGRLVFITPEKYLYVEAAGPLRALLAKVRVEEINLLREDAFGNLVTYPTITVLRRSPASSTRVVLRDGATVEVRLPADSGSWLPLMEGSRREPSAATLADLCRRISCGVATGADGVFVRPAMGLNPALRRFAYPTVAGRQLATESNEVPRESVMLIPYDTNGKLLPWPALDGLGAYLCREDVQNALAARTCVRRKPWYAFHETPVLREILLPKILCKDICESPRFWMDRAGQIVPRHSVYYLVPNDASDLDPIADFLTSATACRWLAQNCQRASKGYLRLQSRVLKRMPVPDETLSACTGFLPRSEPERSPRQAELAFTG